MPGPTGIADPSTAPAPAPSAAPAAPAPAPGNGAAPPQPEHDTSLENLSFTPQQTNKTLSDEDLVKRDSWGAKVYHGVLSALGGSNDISMERDPNTGKMIVTAVKSGPGQQWKRIIAGAIGGAGAAMKGAGRGPGSTMRGAGLGVEAGEAQAQERADRPRREANEDFEIEQKAMNSQAQRAMLNQQTSTSAFQLGRAQVDARFSDADRENKFVEAIGAGGEGSADLGIHPDFKAVVKATGAMPQLHDHQANGLIVSIPHVGADGKIDGMHYGLVTKTWLEKNNDKPLTYYELKPPTKPGEDPVMVPHTIPAGQITNDQYVKGVMATTKDVLDIYTKEQDERNKASRTAAQNAKDYAEAQKARSEAVPNAGNAEVDQDIKEGLASGRYMMGKDIPLRTQKDQTTAAAYTQGANAYSMAHYGLPYSPEIIRQEAKFAESPKVQAFLTGIDRMVGTPGLPGQLDQVLDLSRRAGLGSNAPLNEVSLWVKQHLGLEAQKNFEQGMSDTQTALGTLIGNPLLGSGESDLKLQTAQKQFGSNPTMKDLIGAVATTKDILNRARAQLARNNRYIQQRYGTDYSPAQPQGGAAAPAAQAAPQAGGGAAPPPATPKPAGATGTVMGSDNKLHWTDGKIDLGVAQ